MGRMDLPLHLNKNINSNLNSTKIALTLTANSGSGTNAERSIPKVNTTTSSVYINDITKKCRY